MSSILSKIFWVFVVGLDNAGKTTLINFLETGSTGKTAPTFGVGSRQFNIKGHVVSFLDFGGQQNFRKNWLNQETWGFARRRAKNKNATTVFVHDITDDRWEEAADWYKAVSKGFNIPEIIVFTKTDLIDPESIHSDDLLIKLKLHLHRFRTEQL